LYFGQILYETYFYLLLDLIPGYSHLTQRLHWAVAQQNLSERTIRAATTGMVGMWLRMSAASASGDRLMGAGVDPHLYKPAKAIIRWGRRTIFTAVCI
jgi:hypothetical protein